MSPVLSTRSLGTQFTAQGLGDRVHLITVAWCLSKDSQRSVTLHLHGKQSIERKKKSFVEILDLFPKGYLFLEFHDLEPLDDVEFENYLKNSGIDINRIFYSDYPGWNEESIGIDVSSYLDRIPILSLQKKEHGRKYITSQWDTTGEKRRFEQQEVKEIISRYRSQGYDVITVGGDAQNGKYKKSLFEVAKLMSGAEAHIGVDSGFSHFAQLVLPSSKIHIYSKPGNFWSHHLFRGLDNGMRLNVNFKKISKFSLFLVKLRYNNPRLLRIVHKIRLNAKRSPGRVK